MKNSIRNIIFDFGDVLVRDNIKALEQSFGYNRMPRSMRQKYERACRRSERGETGPAEFIRIISQTLTPKLSPEQINAWLDRHSKLLPPWRMAKSYARIFRIIILSNNHRGSPQKMAKLLKIFPIPFPFVNSAHLGLRKPDIRIYRHVLKKYRLKPEETLYIDDKIENLKPAQKLGINTFWYHNNVGQLAARLRNTPMRKTR